MSQYLTVGKLMSRIRQTERIESDVVVLVRFVKLRGSVKKNIRQMLSKVLLHNVIFFDRLNCLFEN